MPKGEIALGQARVVANIIDGFNQLRAAHRAQQQHDRRLPIEDMASASAAAAPSVPESSSATAAASAPKSKSTAPRGRARTRAQGGKGNQTKDTTDGEREVAGQEYHA